MSYEEYLSALVPKDREYDRYAGAWNEMLAESFDAFLGLGLIYKAVTGEEAFTGDKLTQNEREEAAASGAFALTVSVLTSAIMGLSDSEAFLLSFFAGVVTGNGIERMAYSSPTYIDDLAKRMGKSSDEVADMLGDLSDVAAKYNYSSVDDMLNNLSPAARDDIMKMFDKPLGSFDLDKVDDFKVKNQVFDAQRSYKEILKNSDDIKQIAKNTGLDTEDVKKVKDYLFKEKHLMPDGTYRQFDASEEIADAWKRLTNGKATDDDILLFNHELTELRFVEEGFSVDAAHILSSVDYNWSSVSKIDDFAQKCSEIYGKDFYFGAGTSNEAIDAIVKQIDNLDGQIDDVIEGGSKTIITPEMEEKILLGQRKNPAKNELIGGHSSNINNANPNYAVEVLQTNLDGTQKIKFVTQYGDGNLSNIKTSTIFPDNWSDDKIIDSIKAVGNSSPIGVRTSDGAMLYREIIDDVQIEVIKIGDTVTSGYPTGGIKTGLLPGFNSLE